MRPNPDIEMVQETDSPTGRPRHMYEAPVFRVRPGATAVHWDTWPRVDDAIASYQVFRKLHAEGVIPAGVRFQVGLPFPVSALNGLHADFAADYPVAAPGFADLVAREIGRLAAAVPPGDRRSSGTSPTRPFDIEGVLPWSADGAWTATRTPWTGCRG